MNTSAVCNLSILSVSSPFTMSVVLVGSCMWPLAQFYPVDVACQLSARWHTPGAKCSFRVKGDITSLTKISVHLINQVLTSRKLVISQANGITMLCSAISIISGASKSADPMDIEDKIIGISESGSNPCNDRDKFSTIG